MIDRGRPHLRPAPIIKNFVIPFVGEVVLIYCVHSSAFNFIDEFYKPIQNSASFKKHQFAFPHASGAEPIHSKSVIKACDLVLAEVSHVSTGMGIEIGWADAAGKPILAIHRNGTTISRSIKLVATEVFSYASLDDVMDRLSSIPAT
jgi:hypothetical protein